MSGNIELHPGLTSYTTDCFLFVGDGWVEAKRVWLHFPHPEVDGVEDGEGYEFAHPEGLMRWLRYDG